MVEHRLLISKTLIGQDDNRHRSGTVACIPLRHQGGCSARWAHKKRMVPTELVGGREGGQSADPMDLID